MITQVIMAMAVFATTALAMAQIGVGVKNIVANNTVELAITGTPISYTIGGTYADSTNYIVTGSAVLNCGLGADIASGGPGSTNTTVVNAILEKELAVGNGLAVVFAIDLASYNSTTKNVTALTGGSLGIRNYI